MEDVSVNMAGEPGGAGRSEPGNDVGVCILAKELYVGRCSGCMVAVDCQMRDGSQHILLRAFTKAAATRKQVKKEREPDADSRIWTAFHLVNLEIADSSK